MCNRAISMCDDCRTDSANNEKKGEKYVGHY